MVPSDLLERLRCPQCGRTVVAIAGGVTCADGHMMSFRSGYLDAAQAIEDSATTKTFESFGYEWTTFSGLGPEDEGAWKEYFRDVPLDRVAGKVGLDAGCGKGRFTRFTASHLRFLVALDGSEAVTAAVRNLAALDNVSVVKADIRDAPFAPGSFDFISCLGVLHHLSGPEIGFRRLVELLADGGIMLLYLYSRPDGGGLRSRALLVASTLRKVTVHMPHRLLRVTCAPLAATLYAAFVIPGRIGARYGIAPLTRLPLHSYRGRPLRNLWLDTFDRLSAPLERRYVWSELEPWFQRSGLRVESVRDDAGFYIVAAKP